MSKVSIYALSTEVFPDAQAYFDRSPETGYFYVGKTENLQSRRGAHASNARCGSKYPYHGKIRESGETGILRS